MNKKCYLLLLSFPLIGLLSGCEPVEQQQSAGTEAIRQPEQGSEQTVRFLTLEGQLPAAWQAETPSSSMRLIQHRVPGSDSAGNAELLVFYFGPGQGGTPAANIARWTSQFTSADGAPVQPEVSMLSASEMPVTFVALSGDYARGMGMGPEVATPDQTLLAAIVESTQGNLYIQLHGPMATVSGARDQFLAFVTGLRQTGR